MLEAPVMTPPKHWLVKRKFLIVQNELAMISGVIWRQLVRFIRLKGNVSLGVQGMPRGCCYRDKTGFIIVGMCQENNIFSHKKSVVHLSTAGITL